MDDLKYIWFKQKDKKEWALCSDIEGKGGPVFYGWQYRPNHKEYDEFTFHPDMTDPIEWEQWVVKSEPKLSGLHKLKMIADIFSIEKSK